MIFFIKDEKYKLVYNFIAVAFTTTAIKIERIKTFYFTRT